jgi:translation initiation factor IF-2
MPYASVQHDVVVEDFGGDVMCVPISAFVGTNVDQLIEAVLTQAELLNLRADPTGKSDGDVHSDQRQKFDC